MRETNRYDALKQAHRKEAGQEQQKQPPNERQDASRDEASQEEERQMPESRNRQDTEPSLTPEEKYEAALAARTQELQAKRDAGKITDREMGYELSKFDNAYLAAERGAEPQEKVQNQAGRDESSQQREHGTMETQAQQAGPASEARRDHERGDSRETDAKQQRQASNDRHSSRMEESRRSERSRDGRDDGGRGR
jgi:hypothetical protein